MTRTVVRWVFAAAVLTVITLAITYVGDTGRLWLQVPLALCLGAVVICLVIANAKGARR